jgi:monofunctional glycosyltransferase
MKKSLRKIFRFLFRMFLFIWLISVLWIVLLKWIPVFFTPLMVIRSFEGHEWHYDYVSANDISVNFYLAAVSAEDQKFLSHKGFDWQSIQKAWAGNKDAKRIKGGSTISQQTAKNVFLWPNRSWVRKGLETYFTFMIELIWGKARILEVYSNIVELGPGVYGVEAASQKYFSKSASKINNSEAALLASVLPSPLKYSVSKPSAYVRKRQSWILRQMNNLGGAKSFRKALIPEKEESK